MAEARRNAPGNDRTTLGEGTKMNAIRTVLAGTAALLLGLAQPARAADDVTLHVILPLTGNAAFVGSGQQKTLQLVETLANQEGGIAGHPLKLVFHDDQSSPQQTLQAANSFLPEKPAVFLGSSIVAMCSATAPLLKDGPVDYCLSPGVHPQAGSYLFSSSVSTEGLMEVAVRFFRLKGWTRIATITSSDATGQDADRFFDVLLARAENEGVKLVERQHFTQGDVSVAAQMERIRQAEPQALIAWTTGAALATVLKGAVQAGLDIPVTTTNGNQVNAQMVQYADFLPRQFFIPSSLFVHHQGFKLDPRVEAEQAKFFAAAEAAKLPVDNMAALAWDPARLVIATLRRLGPGVTPAQMRAALAETRDFAGINGLYDLTKVPQRGLDANAAMMVRWDAPSQSWLAVSQPSGTLLEK